MEENTSSSSSSFSLSKYQNKLTELSDFLTSLDTYAPTLPVECIEYYMKRVGVSAEDPRVLKLVALAGDRFMAKMVAEANQECSLRTVKTSKGTKKRKAEQTVTNEHLDMETLQRTLAKSKVNLRRRIMM